MFAKTYHATHPDMMFAVSNDDLRDRYLRTVVPADAGGLPRAYPNDVR